MRDLGVKNDVGQVYAGGVEQKIILKYVHHTLQGITVVFPPSFDTV